MRNSGLIFFSGCLCLLVACGPGRGEPASVLDAGSGGDAAGPVDAQSDTGAAADLAATTQLLVLNPSFELPATGAGTFITSAPPTSWQAYGNINNGYRAVGVLNPNTTTLYLDPVPHGNNVGVAFLLDNPMDQTFYANSEAGLQQTLTETLLPNSEYTLLVDVGNLNTDKGPNNQYAFTGFPNYRIDLLAGGQVVASDTNSLKPGEGRFLLSRVSFVTGTQHAQLGRALGIRLVNLNSSVGIEVNFDNVRLERTAR